MVTPELSAAEQLAHATVRIECTTKSGPSSGTGFIYAFNEVPAADSNVPAIVTNKHVVAGATHGRFLLTFDDGSGGPAIGQFQPFELDQFEKRWMPHPDPNVDLCAMPIAPLFIASPRKFFFRALSSALLPTKDDIADLLGAEDVIMVGYPNGLWDVANNLPIFRKGILATDYKRDWHGRKEFLIDCACFPGSSGSPVLLFDMGSFQTRKGTAVGSSRVKLLGVLYAGPQHTAAGDIRIVTVPTQQAAVAVTGIPNNLGICIKAEQIVALDAAITAKAP